MTDKRIIKCAAELCAISDYFCSKQIKKEESKLTADECVKAFDLMIDYEKNLPYYQEVNNAWKAYSKGKEGIGIKDILAESENWDNKLAFTEYKTVLFDLKAVRKFKQWFIENGGDMYAMEEKLHIYRWKLMGIIEYRDKMIRPLRRAILSLYDNDSVTWEELYAEIQRLRTEK